MLLRIFTEPQQGASYDDLLAVARASEQLGFDAFFRSDHFMVIGEGDGLPGPTDAWVTLGGIARETSRIRLGTLLTSATFRLPGLLAVAVAEVDAMTGGRVELGLGAGWYDTEHAAYGIPFPSFGVRFARLEEQLEVITGLWATPVGERFSFEGDHYRLNDSPALPKPQQQPGPPIIVGGFGPTKTPRLAARFAAEYNVPFASIADTGAAFGRVRAACTATGRDPGSLVYSTAQTVCCGRDATEIARRADAIGRGVGDLRQHALCGTPDELVTKLSEFASAGAERVYLQVLDLADLDHLALLAEKVLPSVTSL